MKQFVFCSKEPERFFLIEAKTRREAESKLIEKLKIDFKGTSYKCSHCKKPLKKKTADNLCGSCRMY